MATDARDVTFQIQYAHQILPESVYICFEFRFKRVKMYRYAADWRLGETEDSFGVHCAETGRLIGSVENTKTDAIAAARYALMNESREEFARQAA